MFLFCFKQKTAYEMRISDWSSDVCSSDLRRLDADLRQGLLDVFPEPLPLLAVWRHVVHDLEAGAIPLAREAGFIQQLVRDLGAVRDVVVLDIVGVEARSEEHTSELQSLMRISYAVFCLNKKNNNKNS